MASSLRDFIIANANNYSAFALANTGEEGLCDIKVLDLGGQGLNRLPDGFGMLENLTLLDLSSNQFEQFPNELLSMPSLRNVRLTGNQLTTLPREIADMSDLKIVHVMRNPILEMPVCLQHIVRNVPYNCRWVD